MNSKVNFLIYIMVALMMTGCKYNKESKITVEKEANVTKTVKMKNETELKATWNNLEKKISETPGLWTNIKQIYSRDLQTSQPSSKQAALRQLYQLLQDPNANPSAATNALEFFVKVDAKDVIRESLLNPRRDVPGWGLVIIASKAIAAKRDEKALNNLIYVLEKNNYPQPGSESATVHQHMKHKLIEAIKEITGLYIKITEINVNDPEQINKVLSMAKTWAKQKGIELFEENKKDNK